jgi:hypothetical protein
MVGPPAAIHSTNASADGTVKVSVSALTPTRPNPAAAACGSSGASHVGDDVERFYAALSPPVTVGIESTGYSLWFHALRQRLGHSLVGEAAKIRAMVVRKTKTDRRDARHLRDLPKDDHFPVVWIPDPTTHDLRALIKHRLTDPGEPVRAQHHSGTAIH